MKLRDSQGEIKTLKHQLSKLRQSSDAALRLGFSKIDFNAEEKAAAFRASRMLGGDANYDLESKMMEFSDVNTYISQYQEKLGCNSNRNITAVDRLFGKTDKGSTCQIDFQSF